MTRPATPAAGTTDLGGNLLADLQAVYEAIEPGRVDGFKATIVIPHVACNLQLTLRRVLKGAIEAIASSRDAEVNRKHAQEALENDSDFATLRERAEAAETQATATEARLATLAAENEALRAENASAEKRRALLVSAVALCINDRHLTDLGTLKRTWFYAETGRDEPVGSRSWEELRVMVREHEAALLASETPDA